MSWTYNKMIIKAQISDDKLILCKLTYYEGRSGLVGVQHHVSPHCDGETFIEEVQIALPIESDASWARD